MSVQITVTRDACDSTVHFGSRAQVLTPAEVDAALVRNGWRLRDDAFRHACLRHPVERP